MKLIRGYEALSTPGFYKKAATSRLELDHLLHRIDYSL